MITKLDLMDEGTDAREILENKLLPLRRGEGLTHGFPLVATKRLYAENQRLRKKTETPAECWKVVIRRPDRENKGEARKGWWERKTLPWKKAHMKLVS